MIVRIISDRNKLAWYSRPSRVGDLFEVELLKSRIPLLKDDYQVTAGSMKGWLIDPTDAEIVESTTDAGAKLAALTDACKTVVQSYESDGMEQMMERDEVFYRVCKQALQ